MKTDMKKILYLHGFASSGASGTVGLLRSSGLKTCIFR